MRLRLICATKGCNTVIGTLRDGTMIQGSCKCPNCGKTTSFSNVKKLEIIERLY